MIVLEDICQTYRLGEHSLRVLEHVHLKLEAKESCAIVGASGSGKSTLLNILGLLDKAESGRFLLDGRDMSQASADERARARNQQIGFVLTWQPPAPNCAPYKTGVRVKAARLPKWNWPTPRPVMTA